MNVLGFNPNDLTARRNLQAVGDITSVPTARPRPMPAPPPASRGPASEGLPAYLMRPQAPVDRAPAGIVDKAKKAYTDLSSNVNFLKDMEEKTKQVDSTIYDKLFEQYKEQVAQRNTDRQLSIHGMMELARESLNTGPAQIDLTPLAQFVDATTGSNFTRAYQKPKTVDERLALATQLKEKAAQTTDAIAKSENDLVRSQIETQLQKQKIEGYNQLQAMKLQFDLAQAFGKQGKKGMMAMPKQWEFEKARKYRQAVMAHNIITQMENSGRFNVQNIKDAAQINRFFPEMLKGDDAKVYEGALLTFANMIGREESGARIQETEEWPRYVKMYFPSYSLLGKSSSRKELMAKRKNREREIESLRQMGQRALEWSKSMGKEDEPPARPTKKAAPPKGGKFANIRAEAASLLGL